MDDKNVTTDDKNVTLDSKYVSLMDDKYVTVDDNNSDHKSAKSQLSDLQDTPTETPKRVNRKEKRTVAKRSQREVKPRRMLQKKNIGGVADAILSNKIHLSPKKKDQDLRKSVKQGKSEEK